MPILAYEGELVPNTTFFGQIAEPNSTIGNDDFWWFYGHTGDVITITANRLENALDPAFYLLRGVGSNTNHLSPLVLADDDIPELPGFAGPFSDPQLLNYVLPGTGFYTVQVWVYSPTSGFPGPDGVYDYQITLGLPPSSEVLPHVPGNGRQPSIPEPASLSLFGLGLLSLAFRQKARR